MVINVNSKVLAVALAVSALSIGCEKPKSGTGGTAAPQTPTSEPALTPPATMPSAESASQERPAASPTTAPSSAAPAAAPATSPAAEAGWQSLFDGKSLDNWKIADFAGHGEVTVDEGVINLPPGEGLTAVVYDKDVPKMNYEVEVVAQKVEGNDFFGSITFPYGETQLTFVTGGWGGTVVGISSIEDEDAAHNETTSYEKFERDRWYTFKVRVEPKKITGYIDGKPVMELETEGKRLSLRAGMEPATPLGVCAWQTEANIKSIRLRKID